MDMNDESIECKNIYPNSKGELKQLGYKSFSGLVRVLRTINKNCKKLDFHTEITIKFPIP